MTTVTPLYRCAQQELYSAARIGWESNNTYEAEFLDFSPLYTPAYRASALAELAAAEALPDDVARAATPATQHVYLEKDAAACCKKWRYLKRYIAKAFADDVLSIKNSEAGQTHYSKAAHSDWEEVFALMNSGVNFINLYETELLANNNMPPSFKAGFQQVFDAFKATHQAFTSDEQASAAKTSVKITANNKVYARLIEMFLDGQQIFHEEVPIVNRFIFARVLHLVSGSGPSQLAAIMGRVTDANTDQPLWNAEVKLNDDIPVLSSQYGDYTISSLAQGEYLVQVMKTGYQPYTQIVNLAVGEQITLDMALVPIL